MMIPYLEDWNDDNYDLPRFGGEDDYNEDDDTPTCRDCGSELDPNGFCDECSGDPWE